MLFTFAANLSYTAFLRTSFFTISLSLFKSTGTGPNFSMCDLSTSVFRLAKFVFSAKFEVSICVIFFRSVFVAWLERSTLTLIFPPKLLNSLEKY